MASIAGEKPHAVCMPVPSQGHINSMLKLAKILHFKGIHITFVHTEFNYNRILQNSTGPSSLNGLPDFRFEAIPDGLPPSDPNSNQDITALSVAIRNNLSAPFRDLLKRLHDPSSDWPPVTCIVSDVFTSFTLEIAAELRIPDVFFCSISACSYMAYLHFKELIERGLVPLRSESDHSNGYLDTPIDWIPGMSNMLLRDLPSFVRTTDPNEIFFNFCKDESQEAFKATAIILNTFDDLEGPVLDAMSLILPPVYTIGPLSLLYRQILDNPLKSIGSNLWKEDSGCLEWLEGRAPRSVIYLNFGSLAVLKSQQLIEFAWGLANSGHDFLWVIRPDIVKDDSAILPKEFLAETGGRGLLTSWCPQEEVLMHPSIGGFLTHCGWNSTMESISGGVPMICWPFFGDQQTNCRYVRNEWGIGVEINTDVNREEVEGIIRELIGGEKGKEMRKKALKWKESAVRATQPGGKSFLNFQRVLEEILLQSKECF